VQQPVPGSLRAPGLAFLHLRGCFSKEFWHFEVNKLVKGNRFMTSINSSGTFQRVLLLGLVIGLLCLSARADLLEMVNGDHYSGRVIGMTQTNLEFQSDVQGLVKIPRTKVASISLRPVVKPAAAATPGQLGSPLVATTAAGSVSNAPSDAVVQQLRQQGVDPKMMDQLQQQLLGTSSPEATRMFNEMVGGLTTGSSSIQDIRAQAQKSLKDIQAAKKDMGSDSADLLDGYAAILQKFVNETETPTKPVGAKPNPALPAQAPLSTP
jgi:hypothetical protein